MKRITNKVRIMKNKTNKLGKHETRRTFIKSTGLVTAGLILTPTTFSMAGARGWADQETLALNGGPKAVTASHEDSTTWPRYGAEEEKAVLEVLRNPVMKLIFVRAGMEEAF